MNTPRSHKVAQFRHPHLIWHSDFFIAGFMSHALVKAYWLAYDQHQCIEACIR